METAQFQHIQKALSDPTRFEIFERIAGSDETACSDLREHLSITPATLSHHLKELAEAGLIHTRREAKFMFVSLDRKVWKAYLGRLQKI